MHSNHIFEQVLRQIELGHPGEAITRLLALLDLAPARGLNAGLRAALVAHPLFALLQADPVFAQALLRRDDRIDRMIEAINTPLSHTDSVPTRVMVAEALHQTSLYRAIRARQAYAADLLHRAWLAGRAMAIVGASVPSERVALRGRDLSNLTLVTASATSAARLRQSVDATATIMAMPPADWIGHAIAAGQRFDLIYLPRAADTLPAAGLATLVARAALLLTKGGSIVAPAFLATRIGKGWQQIGLDWPVTGHDEARLSAAIVSPNLNVRTIGDSDGCCTWLVVSNAGGARQKKGKQS